MCIRDRYEGEHDGYGYPFLKPSDRIGMMREGVEIMKAMWTEDVVSYEGDHYKLDGAICRPKPVQDPHVPFWIAGGGEQLTLNVAARYAQYTNFATSVEEFKHKSSVLQGHCEDVETEFSDIVRSSNFNVFCTETEDELDEKIDWYADQMAEYVDEDKARRQAEQFRENSGTPEQVVDNLKRWESAGMGYAIIYFGDAAYDPNGIELFGKEVIPAFQ